MTTTTLTRHRIPLTVLSMNTQSQQRRSKRVAAYDEEDDGFKFTRASKRAKKEAAATAVEADPLKTATPKQTPVRQRNGKAQDDGQVEKKAPLRRQMNFATPKLPKVPAKPPPRTGTRRSARLSTGDSSATKAPESAVTTETAVDYDRVDILEGMADQPAASHTKVAPRSPMKIKLPFSDTPVINRNKELRKTNGGRRRSSLGLRGRRASSLIDSGHSATPHEQVETAHFYKHIEAEGLSEPRRMKQLLIWCGERALGPKPVHGQADNGAVLAARPIQEAILKAFSQRSDMSDWFSREEPVRPTVIKKPNPLDAQNAAKIQELEAQIEKLKTERERWRALRKPVAPLSPILPHGDISSPSEVDPALLNVEDAQILASLQADNISIRTASTIEMLKEIDSGLEFKVDQFAHGVHALTRTRELMDRVASRVMALSAGTLEERERMEKEAVGTKEMPIMEVLRSLSRIMPDGGS